MDFQYGGDWTDPVLPGNGPPNQLARTATVFIVHTANIFLYYVRHDVSMYDRSQ